MIDQAIIGAMVGGVGPLVVDFAKSLLQRFMPVDAYKPTNIAEWVEMQRIELEKFKAMQDSGADTGIPIVNAVIRLQRPLYAFIALGIFGYQELFMLAGATPTTATLTSAVVFWLFGEKIQIRTRAAMVGEGAK